MRFRSHSVVLLFAVLAAVVAVAAAVASNRPVIAWASTAPADGATLTTGSGNWDFTYNRTPKQTASGYPVCSLTGPATFTPISAACVPPTAIAGGSASRASYGGLPSGSYTLTVTLRLTDGGTTSAVRHFSVDAEPQSEIDCTGVLDGTYLTDGPGWSCSNFLYQVPVPGTGLSILQTDCTNELGPDAAYVPGTDDIGTNRVDGVICRLVG